MTAAPRRWAVDLLHCWFHRLRRSDWFSSSSDVDAMLARRFGADLARLGGQSAKSFLTDPLTARAAILLFDQVPRNIHRGSARAFAFDPLARDIAKAVVARGWDRSLPIQARQFVYMPLMHSEAIADQEQSLALFSAHARGNLSFARSHHRMIARFGRFPHRNEALGRRSTPAELAAIAAGFHW